MYNERFMRMAAKIKVKKLVLALCIILSMLLMVFGAKKWLDRSIDVGKKAALAVKVSSLVNHYLDIFQGHFPKDEEELLQGLKSIFYPELESDSAEYIRENNNNRHVLSFFKIHYGIAINDLERKGDELYHKRTGKKIILIEGPYQSDLGDLYNLISVSLYEKMKEEQKGGSNNNITSQDISEIDR